MTDRRALLILGMHRSGTSALARILNLCGAALPEALLPANHANVRGYWEPAAVVALHDRLLADAGSRWDDPTEFPAGWFESEAAARYARELADVIAADFGSAPLLVIKDPRACRLVSIWKQALSLLAIEPIALIVTRPAIEIAASLHQRDGLAESHGLLLWLQHVLAAEADTRNMRRLVLSFDDLLSDWTRVIDRIRTELNVPLCDPAPAVDEHVREFLDPALRHQRAVDLADVPDELGWVDRVQSWHDRAGAGVEPDRHVLDHVRAELRRVDAIYAPAIRNQIRERSEVAARCQVLESDRAELERRLQDSERHAREQADREQARDREWQARHDEAARAQADLQAIIARMQQHPAWRAADWMARQRARLTGRPRS